MPTTQSGLVAIAFVSFGVNIGITLVDYTLFDDVLERFPPGWRWANSVDLHRRYRIANGEGVGYSISIDDREPIEFGQREPMLDFLEGDIQIHVAEFATPHLFVHAGVVVWDGAAILLPGRSFAGKSTLVTSLVKAGATYYSDEYAVLDGDGRVLPYPRRVSLRSGPHGPTGRLDLSAYSPSESEAMTPIPVGLVALLRYEPHAVWSVETLPTLPGIMALSEQTVAIQRRPGDTLTILRRVADSAVVIQGIRGEVDEAVAHLLAFGQLRTR